MSLSSIWKSVTTVLDQKNCPPKDCSYLGDKSLLEHNKKADNHLSEIVNREGQPYYGYSLAACYVGPGSAHRQRRENHVSNYRTISVNSQVASGMSLSLPENFLSQ